jgi:hypothetical protein
LRIGLLREKLVVDEVRNITVVDHDHHETAVVGVVELQTRLPSVF